jgi:ribosome-associated translation inhibitor RaiA
MIDSAIDEPHRDYKDGSTLALVFAMKVRRALVEPMRIEVAGSPAECADRLRSYAEYRVFSRLAPVGDHISTVRVIVRTLARGSATSCLLVADLGPGGTIQARAQSTQPSTAIDLAVARLEATVRDRLNESAPIHGWPPRQ